MLTLAILLGGATALRGSEQDEPRDKAKAIQKEDAERLKQKARELREAKRRDFQARRKNARPQIEREIGDLKERLSDLLIKQQRLAEANAPGRDRAEMRDRFAAKERGLIAVREKLAGGHPPRPEFEAQARMIEEAARRMQHIKVAAENLKAAGIDELAGKLMEQAETMQRELADAKQRLGSEMARRSGPDARDAEVRELRQQNERLQLELKELRQRLERQ
jgi:hypothetical protein